MGSIATDPITMPSPSMSTDYLVIGAGPAGASLACFLARYNLRGLLVSSAAGPAKTPRAHLSNPPALECLRDVDLAMYEECLRLSNTGDFIKHYRWCETMAGEEYARQLAWGSGDRKGEYEQLTPCQYMDLPQVRLYIQTIHMRNMLKGYLHTTEPFGAYTAEVGFFSRLERPVRHDIARLR
jgi:hypothetical protein